MASSKWVRCTASESEDSGAIVDENQYRERLCDSWCEQPLRQLPRPKPLQGCPRLPYPEDDRGGEVDDSEGAGDQDRFADVAEREMRRDQRREVEVAGHAGDRGGQSGNPEPAEE